MRYNITEVDHYRFIQIPMDLITNKRYAKLEPTGKLLYGLLLSRLNISRINKWVDENGDIYFFFKVQDIGDTLGLSRPTVSNYLKKLEEFGLLDKIAPTSFGAPSRFYLHKTEPPRNDSEHNPDLLEENYTLMAEGAPNDAPVYQSFSDMIYEAGANVQKPINNAGSSSYPQTDDSRCKEILPRCKDSLHRCKESLHRCKDSLPYIYRDKYIEYINRKNNNSHGMLPPKEGTFLEDVVVVFFESCGVSGDAIRELAAIYGEDKVIDKYHLLIKSRNIKNPMGFLIRALEGNYTESITPAEADKRRHEEEIRYQIEMTEKRIEAEMRQKQEFSLPPDSPLLKYVRGTEI